jgi:hypothetical protein
MKHPVLNEVLSHKPLIVEWTFFIIGFSAVPTSALSSEIVHYQACRSGVSAVRVEVFVNDAG